MPRKKGRRHSETVEGNKHSANNKSCKLLNIDICLTITRIYLDHS